NFHKAHDGRLPGVYRRAPLRLESAMKHPAAQSTISSRREYLRVGLAGFGSLSLPGLLRLRAEASVAQPEPTALILVWLRGGCSHLDTYDPKPDATDEYRGPFGTIATKTPGLRFSELIPRQAALSDEFTLLRSLAHTGGGHPSG